MPIQAIENSDRRRSIIRLVLALALATLVALAVVYRPDRAIKVVTGVVAHDICSKTFVSGLDPALVMDETMTRSGIRWLRRLVGVSVDRQARTVDATYARVIRSHAVYRDGAGCVLVNRGSTPYQPKINRKALMAVGEPGAGAPLSGPDAAEPEDAKMKAVLDGAFAEPPSPPLRRTKAVLILRDGHVIAERYAPGVGIDTPLMGFSLTKTVTNALIGLLVHQGRLKTSDPAPIAEWQKPGDPRRAITTEHLMRMASGLDFDETNTGFDRSSRMLYLDDDMATAAAAAPVIAAPGTRYHYASPSTILLGRIIRDAVGGTPEKFLEFAWADLFRPLGMRNVTIEFDAAGNPITSTYMFATARDWARLGQLYLDDGKVAGHRLLPEGWVEFSARSTLNGYYGAGVWTVRSPHPWSQYWIKNGFPPDAFFGSGDLGQRIVVLPTQRIVIVRLGDAVDPDGDMPGLQRLIRDTISAVTP